MIRMIGRRTLAALPNLLGVIVITFVLDARAARRPRRRLRRRRRHAGGDRPDPASAWA
jgi:hypothetical protein